MFLLKYIDQNWVFIKFLLLPPSLVSCYTKCYCKTIIGNRGNCAYGLRDRVKMFLLTYLGVSNTKAYANVLSILSSIH